MSENDDKDPFSSEEELARQVNRSSAPLNPEARTQAQASQFEQGISKLVKETMARHIVVLQKIFWLQYIVFKYARKILYIVVDYIFCNSTVTSTHTATRATDAPIQISGPSPAVPVRT